MFKAFEHVSSNGSAEHNSEEFHGVNFRCRFNDHAKKRQRSGFVFPCKKVFTKKCKFDGMYIFVSRLVVR